LGAVSTGLAQYLRLELLYEKTDGEKETVLVQNVESVDQDFVPDGLVRENGEYFYDVFLKSEEREYLLETVYFDIPNVKIGESFNWKEGQIRAEIERLSRVVFPFRMPIYENAFLIRFYRKPAGEKSAPRKIGEWEYPPDRATKDKK